MNDEELRRVLDGLKSRVATLETKIKDVDGNRMRERDESRYEMTSMLEGHKQAVEMSVRDELKPILSMVPQQFEQTEILRESRDERVRRAERERLNAEADRAKAAAREELQRKRDFWLKAAAISIGALTPIGTILAAYFAMRGH